jgi:hypothetical protein
LKRAIAQQRYNKKQFLWFEKLNRPKIFGWFAPWAFLFYWSHNDGFLGAYLPA